MFRRLRYLCNRDRVGLEVSHRVGPEHVGEALAMMANTVSQIIPGHRLRKAGVKPIRILTNNPKIMVPGGRCS